MENTKKCRLCKSQIDKDAKKCPVCRGIQNRFFSPIIPIVLLNILIAILIGMALWAICDICSDVSAVCGISDAESSYNNGLVITESELKFGKDKCDKDAVIIIGKIKNDSSANWHRVNFETRCFDPDDKLTDTAQESNYDFMVPARQEIPFKVSFTRQLPEDQYLRHEIRVIDARKDR